MIELIKYISKYMKPASATRSDRLAAALGGDRQRRCERLRHRALRELPPNDGAQRSGAGWSGILWGGLDWDIVGRARLVWEGVAAVCEKLNAVGVVKDRGIADLPRGTWFRVRGLGFRV